MRKLPGCWAVGMEVQSQWGWEGIRGGTAWLSDATEIPQGRRGWVGGWGARLGAKCSPPPCSVSPKDHPPGLQCFPHPHPWVGFFHPYLHSAPYLHLCLGPSPRKESKQTWAFWKTLAHKVWRQKGHGEGKWFGQGPSQSEAGTRAPACCTNTQGPQLWAVHLYPLVRQPQALPPVRVTE